MTGLQMTGDFSPERVSAAKDALIKICLEALDFYSKPERYQSKSKKQKPRIMQDQGTIARRAVEMCDPSGDILRALRNG